MCNSTFGCKCGNLKANSPPCCSPGEDNDLKPVGIKPGGFSIRSIDDISIEASRECCFEITCKRCFETFRVKIENNMAFFQKVKNGKRSRRLSGVEKNLPYQLQKFITSPQYSPLFFDSQGPPPLEDFFSLEQGNNLEDIDDVDIDLDLMFSDSTKSLLVGSYCNHAVLFSGDTPY